MSYKSEFQANNVDLQGLIDIVKNLPDQIIPDTPVISVSSGGLITATANGESETKQLPTQAAKTVTPGTSNQTAVAAGMYTTGAVTVAGDADLVAGNIKSGVNIFGVAGTFTSDATAAASDIASGKTAYVNGSKVTGTAAKAKGRYGNDAGQISTFELMLFGQWSPNYTRKF